MYVLVTYRDEVNQMKNEDANYSVAGLIWPNFEPIQAFIVDLVTCKNKEDPIKNEGARVVTLSINF